MKKLILSLTFVLSILLPFSLTDVYAQNIPQDVSGVNVQEMSDSQLTDLLQRSKASGLTDEQIIRAAQARGLSEQQAVVLRQRLAKLQGSSPNTQQTIQSTGNTSRSLNYRPQNNGDSLASNANKGPRIFGADMFRNGNLTFEPDLKIATPVNYVLGPDDQLNINVYGNSLVNWKLDVSPEGSINIPGVGMVSVAGKTIAQATTAIKARLAANNYAVGRGTSVVVTLGNIRSIKVIIVGEARKPGTYTLPSLATAFNALYAAGGPNNVGSFRRIEIIRTNKVIRTLDIYDFLSRGDQKNNISLQDQDIIRIPAYRTRVELAGQVKNPALFEVLPGESLQKIIDYAGGFTDSAYTARIKVLQISNRQRKIADVVESNYSTHIPARGDKYIVESIIERFENRVTINGAVFRPGEYELRQGLTLSQLIQNAAGLKEDAFTARASITRLKPDNTTELISFSPQGVLSKQEPDMPLQREDIVHIASIFDLRDDYMVNIEGSVRSPGKYAYAENMSVEDLIIMAGGFKEGASNTRIEVSRRVNDSDPLNKNASAAQVFTVDVNKQLSKSTNAFKLQPYDVVSVYGQPGYEEQRTIRIEGEVLYPGLYTIQRKNEKISDVIKRAGGLTIFADVEGSSLKRTNYNPYSFKSDTLGGAVQSERQALLSRLNRNYNDTASLTSEKLRNDYVGINLKRILDKPGDRTDLILEDGDILRVPKQQQVVRVNGEVLFPSSVIFSKGKTLKGYVLNAGGFSPAAHKSGAYVVYPNGTVEGTRKFLFFSNYPTIKPGSEIFIPKKTVKRGLSTTEIIGLTGGLASLGAIVLGIISLTK